MRPALVAIALLLALAPQAPAATVEIGTSTLFPPNQATIVFKAAPGERNRVVARHVRTPSFAYDIVVQDAGATLSAGAGCLSLDAHTARCDAPPAVPPATFSRQPNLAVDVADGDDAVATPATFIMPVIVRGGDGNDVLSGAAALLGEAGDDVLTGSDEGPGYKGSGPAGDVLSGGDGDDVLRGGGGDDELNPGPGDDAADGGPGDDRVSYEERSTSVRIDLAGAGSSGSGPGERDRFEGVEHAVGGSGDDVLLGNAERNTLRGGPGDDRLVGRDAKDQLYGDDGADVLDGQAGHDDLYGGPGGDTLRGGVGDDDLQSGGDGDALDGGPGDDSFFAGNPRTLRCGSGSDRVGVPRGLLLADCESVLVGTTQVPAGSDTATISAQPRRRARSLGFTWSCDSSATVARCDVRVTVRLPGSPALGRRSAVLLKRGATGEIAVRLSRTIRSGRLVEVSIGGTVDEFVFPGVARKDPFTARWRVRV